MSEVVRVLQSFREPRATTNPYIVMLYRAMGSTSGIDVIPFSWRTALLGGYDVFHVHWPEVRLEGRSWPLRLLRHVLFAALLLKLRILRIPIVRTRHNLAQPSGIPTATSLLLTCLERQTAREIVLTDVSGDSEAALIPHGHYRDWFAEFPKVEAKAGHFSYFGLVRNYKGLTALVQAFRGLQGDHFSLTIAGNPSREELVAELRDAALGDERINFDFRFLPDAELVRVATEGQLVVLPYREMHNSGGVLAALSLGRPVLVPQNEVNDRLAEEVGEEWVLRYDGEISPGALSEAMIAAASIPADGLPNLSKREWDDCGIQHLAVFRAAVEKFRGGHG